MFVLLVLLLMPMLISNICTYVLVKTSFLDRVANQGAANLALFGGISLIYPWSAFHLWSAVCVFTRSFYTLSRIHEVVV